MGCWWCGPRRVPGWSRGVGGSPGSEDARLHVLESLPEGVALLDGEGRITYCNRALKQVFGEGAESIEGRRFFELAGSLPGHQPGQGLPGSSRRVEIDWHHGKRLYRVSAFPGVAGDGVSRGIVVVVRDVSEQRLDRERAAESAAAAELAETRLKELEADLRLIDRFDAGGRKQASYAPLSRRRPSRYQAIVERYEGLFDELLRESAFGVPEALHRGVSGLACDLGRLRAGPRDVIELHAEALRRRNASTVGGMGVSIAEEGRFLLLELMGDLAAWYRERLNEPSGPHEGAWSGDSSEERPCP